MTSSFSHTYCLSETLRRVWFLTLKLMLTWAWRRVSSSCSPVPPRRRRPSGWLESRCGRGYPDWRSSDPYRNPSPAGWSHSTHCATTCRHTARVRLFIIIMQQFIWLTDWTRDASNWRPPDDPTCLKPSCYALPTRVCGAGSPPAGTWGLPVGSWPAGSLPGWPCPYETPRETPRDWAPTPRSQPHPLQRSPGNRKESDESEDGGGRMLLSQTQCFLSSFRLWIRFNKAAACRAEHSHRLCGHVPIL